MALQYFLYYVVPASGQASLTIPVSCDIPPTFVTKALFSAQYRDLPGAGTSTLGNAPLLMQTNISMGSATTVETSALTTGTISASDDISHTPWRQDPVHEEDYLIFTDSLGYLCGAFPNPPGSRISFNNTGLPGSTPSAPATAPH